MRKDEAETKIRYLCSRWADYKGIPMDGSVDPSFMEFYNWVHSEGYGSVFDFRGAGGAMGYANQWFDEEFKQTWKN